MQDPNIISEEQKSQLLAYYIKEFDNKISDAESSLKLLAGFLNDHAKDISDEEKKEVQKQIGKMREELARKKAEAVSALERLVGK